MGEYRNSKHYIQPTRIVWIFKLFPLLTGQYDFLKVGITGLSIEKLGSKLHCENEKINMLFYQTERL